MFVERFKNIDSTIPKMLKLCSSKFPVLWFGLVSRVGASHRVNLIARFLLGQACPRRITMTMKNKLPPSSCTFVAPYRQGKAQVW